MQLQDFYPIIVTEHLAACRDFYRRWFSLEVVFEATWFVRLGTEKDGRASLAFMHPSHPSAPPGPEVFTGKGMCLEFQVPDARAEYARFQAGKATIVLELRDERFGQRRFGLFDPAGVWIDIVGRSSKYGISMSDGASAFRSAGLVLAVCGEESAD